MGNFRVIDALATLAFDFPAGRKDRSEFFRDELENWFVLCKSEGIDPLAWKGSYAGAIGMAQFMPSSFNKYAVDLDGDGHVNLHESAADVIGSVAHYMAEFGWKRGLPVRFSVQPPADTATAPCCSRPTSCPPSPPRRCRPAARRCRPKRRASTARSPWSSCENGDAAPSYVAGTSNFYAVTRYNWSSYYAMAVVELGEAVRRARGEADAALALGPVIRGRRIVGALHGLEGIDESESVGVLGDGRGGQPLLDSEGCSSRWRFRRSRPWRCCTEGS